MEHIQILELLKDKGKFLIVLVQVQVHGSVITGDHVHLETGKGRPNLSQYRYHFLDNTDCKRITPDKVLFVNNTYVVPKTGYDWIEYTGGTPTPISLTRKKFPWPILTRKLRNRRNRRVV